LSASLKEFGKKFRQALEDGFRAQIQHHTAETNVYGEAAVAIGYEMNTWYSPHGPCNISTGRVTRILNKVNGHWEVVHIHRSRGGFVQPENTETSAKAE